MFAVRWAKGFSGEWREGRPSGAGFPRTLYRLRRLTPAELDGRLRALKDLLIGATALHLGYEAATLNLRDFKKIPGLSLVQL